MGGGSHGVQKGFLARVHVRNHTGVLRGTFSCLGAEIFTPRCEMAGIPSGLANREPATEGYRPGWRRFTGNGPNKVPYTYARIRCTNVMYALLCMLWTHCWDIYDPHFLSHAGALPCVNIAPPAYNYKSF